MTFNNDKVILLVVFTYSIVKTLFVRRLKLAFIKKLIKTLTGHYTAVIILKISLYFTQSLFRYVHMYTLYENYRELKNNNLLVLSSLIQLFALPGFIVLRNK